MGGRPSAQQLPATAEAAAAAAAASVAPAPTATTAADPAAATALTATATATAALLPVVALEEQEKAAAAAVAPPLVLSRIDPVASTTTATTIPTTTSRRSTENARTVLCVGGGGGVDSGGGDHGSVVRNSVDNSENHIVSPPPPTTTTTKNTTTIVTQAPPCTSVVSVSVSVSNSNEPPPALLSLSHDAAITTATTTTATTTSTEDEGNTAAAATTTSQIPITTRVTTTANENDDEQTSFRMQNVDSSDENKGTKSAAAAAATTEAGGDHDDDDVKEEEEEKNVVPRTPTPTSDTAVAATNDTTPTANNNNNDDDDDDNDEKTKTLSSFSPGLDNDAIMQAEVDHQQQDTTTTNALATTIITITATATGPDTIETTTTATATATVDDDDDDEKKSLSSSCPVMEQMQVDHPNEMATMTNTNTVATTDTGPDTRTTQDDGGDEHEKKILSSSPILEQLQVDHPKETTTTTNVVGMDTTVEEEEAVVVEQQQMQEVAAAAAATTTGDTVNKQKEKKETTNTIPRNHRRVYFGGNLHGEAATAATTASAIVPPDNPAFDQWLRQKWNEYHRRQQQDQNDQQQEQSTAVAGAETTVDSKDKEESSSNSNSNSNNNDWTEFIRRDILYRSPFDYYIYSWIRHAYYPFHTQVASRLAQNGLIYLIQHRMEVVLQLHKQKQKQDDEEQQDDEQAQEKRDDDHDHAEKEKATTRTETASPTMPPALNSSSSYTPWELQAALSAASAAAFHVERKIQDPAVATTAAAAAVAKRDENNSINKMMMKNPPPELRVYLGQNMTEGATILAATTTSSSSTLTPPDNPVFDQYLRVKWKEYQHQRQQNQQLQPPDEGTDAAAVATVDNKDKLEAEEEARLFRSNNNEKKSDYLTEFIRRQILYQSPFQFYVYSWIRNGYYPFHTQVASRSAQTGLIYLIQYRMSMLLQHEQEQPQVQCGDNKEQEEDTTTIPKIPPLTFYTEWELHAALSAASAAALPTLSTRRPQPPPRSPPVNQQPAPTTTTTTTTAATTTATATTTTPPLRRSKRKRQEQERAQEEPPPPPPSDLQNPKHVYLGMPQWECTPGGAALTEQFMARDWTEYESLIPPKSSEYIRREVIAKSSLEFFLPEKKKKNTNKDKKNSSTPYWCRQDKVNASETLVTKVQEYMEDCFRLVQVAKKLAFEELVQFETNRAHKIPIPPPVYDWYDPSDTSLKVYLGMPFWEITRGGKAFFRYLVQFMRHWSLHVQSHATAMEMIRAKIASSFSSCSSASSSLPFNKLEYFLYSFETNRWQKEDKWNCSDRLLVEVVKRINRCFPLLEEYSQLTNNSDDTVPPRLRQKSHVEQTSLLAPQTDTTAATATTTTTAGLLKETRKGGAGKFSVEEINSFLDLADQYLPIRDKEWKSVARLHSRGGRYFRKFDALRKKFLVLQKMKTSTADPDLITTIVRVKKIYLKMQNKKRESFVVLEDEEEENNEQRYQDLEETDASCESDDDDDRNNNMAGNRGEQSQHTTRTTTAIMAAGMPTKGFQKGAGAKFPNEETVALLDLLEQHLPTSDVEWATVARLHNEKLECCRKVNALRKKFNTLKSRTISEEDDSENLTANVLRAKQIELKIKKSIVPAAVAAAVAENETPDDALHCKDIARLDQQIQTATNIMAKIPPTFSAAKFSDKETNALLDLVEEYLPIGEEWATVTRLHLEKFPNRTYDAPRKRFISLKKETSTTIDIPPTVARAKAIDFRIDLKILLRAQQPDATSAAVPENDTLDVVEMEATDTNNDDDNNNNSSSNNNNNNTAAVAGEPMHVE